MPCLSPMQVFVKGDVEWASGRGAGGRTVVNNAITSCLGKTSSDVVRGEQPLN